MYKEILIYGLEQGETRDYMESLLACFPVTNKSASNVEAVKAAARAAAVADYLTALAIGLGLTALALAYFDVL